MKSTYVSVFVITVAVAGIGFAINGYRSANGYSHAPAIAPAEQHIDAQLPSLGPIRNLRFTLFEAGIRPSEMRINAGLVNIHIEDRTNTSQGLIIQRILPTERVALGTISKTPNQARGRSSFRLPPGQYELIDASQPANKAVLLVEP